MGEDDQEWAGGDIRTSSFGSFAIRNRKKKRKGHEPKKPVLPTIISIIAAANAGGCLWLQLTSLPIFHAASIARFLTAIVDTIAERDPTFRARLTERMAAPQK